MKTSHILLAIVAVITLTGMIATNVLLKRQYALIDWSNPFQDFEQRTLPTARHWVINGDPASEIIVEQRAVPQMLVRSNLARFYTARQRGDTVFVTFALDHTGQNNPRDADYELPAGLVLRVPDLQSLRVLNGRLTLRKFALAKLVVSMQKSRLRTQEMTVTGPFDLTVEGYSEAVLGTDQYRSLRAVVRDSSGMRLNNTQASAFASEVSPNADVQLRGRALQWLK